VLFTGLDFSYPRNLTHARSTPVHRGMLRSCSRLHPCGMNAFETLLARPRLRLPGKGGTRVLTDLVLDSYARQLSTVNAAGSRSFDLSAEGLPVGARRVDTIAELQALCGAAAPARSAGIGMGRAGAVEPAATSRSKNHHRIASDALLRFCRREEELLSGVVRSTSGSVRIPSDARSALEYLFLTTPEADPSLSQSPQNLDRVERLAGVLRLCLQRTRAALEGAE
jgi:hypothetical protein